MHDSFANLSEIARSIRLEIINMVHLAGSGHLGGAMGMVEILVSLYFSIMKHDPNNPDWSNRDIFLLSNGHTAPVQYATMAHRGYFETEELQTLRQFGSRLQGHPERQSLPGLENTSGPLGSGVSQASGMAYAMKYLDKRNDRTVFVMTGDGELNEGNVWESLMFASKYQLDNLIVFVDRNNIQIDGTTDEVMPLGNLASKWRSFGWHTQEIDGHSFESIHFAVNNAKAKIDQPSVIIAHTTPGKGVDFMENNYRWHGKTISDDETRRALEQLAGASHG